MVEDQEYEVLEDVTIGGNEYSKGSKISINPDVAAAYVEKEKEEEGN